MNFHPVYLTGGTEEKQLMKFIAVKMLKNVNRELGTVKGEHFDKQRGVTWKILRN